MAMGEDFKEALNYAFLLLRYRNRTGKELLCRLNRKGYSRVAARNTLKYLKDCGYVNDRKFVKSFVTNSVNKGWGRRKIEVRLRKLGVCQSLAAAALGDKALFKEKIRVLVENKIDSYRKKNNGYQKLARYLASRGFDYADIASVLREFSFGYNQLNDD